MSGLGKFFKAVSSGEIHNSTEFDKNFSYWVWCENYLEENPQPSNRRNGYSGKTAKSSSGSFELETSRDRTGDFEPQLVKQNQTL